MFSSLDAFAETCVVSCLWADSLTLKIYDEFTGITELCLLE
jgi:hypothetical protein